jgi:hypothetical protein
VLSRALKRYYDPLRLPLGRPPLPGASGYRRELLPGPRRFGAEEALSSSHDTLLTIPRPLRRRVPWHPLQAPRCRPWPSPAEWRLGSLLAAVAVFLTTPQASLDAADWSVALRPASTPGSRPTPGAALPGTLASPRTGPTPAGCRELVARLHRRSLPSVTSAPELLDAHSGGITMATAKPSSGSLPGWALASPAVGCSTCGGILLLGGRRCMTAWRSSVTATERRPWTAWPRSWLPAQCLLPPPTT